MRDLNASSKVPTRLLVRIRMPRREVSGDMIGCSGFLQWDKIMYTVVVLKNS